jgi:hypothetical protein
LQCSHGEELVAGKAVFLGVRDYEELFQRKPKYMVKTKIFPVDPEIQKIFQIALIQNTHARNMTVQYPTEIDELWGNKRLNFLDEAVGRFTSGPCNCKRIVSIV